MTEKLFPGTKRILNPYIKIFLEISTPKTDPSTVVAITCTTVVPGFILLDIRFYPATCIVMVPDWVPASANILSAISLVNVACIGTLCLVKDNFLVFCKDH